VKLYLLAWGVACLGASTASAGVALLAPHTAVAGIYIWVLAVWLQIMAAARRYLGMGRADVEGIVARR